MSSDTSGIKGEVTVELRGPDGELKAREVVENLITDTGDTFYGSRAIAAINSNGVTAAAQPSGMQIGTGSTAVAKNGAGSAMVTYLIGQAFDATYPTGADAAGAGYTATYKVTYAAGTGTTASAITEACIVTGTVTTAGTAATTISRVLLTGIGSKGASDTLTVTWTHKLLGA
jgi:hypothetical protein